MPPTIIYKRGDVLLVEIAFTGSIGRKRRPAVVSTDNFNNAGIKITIAAITSNVSLPFRPGDTLINDWNAAGLIKISAVRGILVTVDKRDVIWKLGRTSGTDFANVIKGLAEVIDLISPL